MGVIPDDENALAHTRTHTRAHAALTMMTTTFPPSPHPTRSAVELPPSSLRRLTLQQRAGDEDWRATTRVFLPLSDDETRDFGGFADFPTVSSLSKGRKHRFVWLSGAVRPTNVTNALVKFDLETKASLTWHEPGALPGESCFVARPVGIDRPTCARAARLSHAHSHSRDALCSFARAPWTRTTGSS